MIDFEYYKDGVEVKVDCENASKEVVLALLQDAMKENDQLHIRIENQRKQMEQDRKDRLAAQADVYNHKTTITALNDLLDQKRKEVERLEADINTKDRQIKKCKEALRKSDSAWMRAMEAHDNLTTKIAGLESEKTNLEHHNKSLMETMNIRDDEIKRKDARILELEDEEKKREDLKKRINAFYGLTPDYGKQATAEFHDYVKKHVVLNGDIENLRAENSLLQKEIADKESIISMFQAEIDAAKNNAYLDCDDVKALRLAIGLRDKDIIRHTHNNAELAKQNRELVDKLSKITIRRNRWKQRYYEANDRAVDLQKMLIDANQRNDNQLRIINHLNEEIDTLNGVNTELRDRLDNVRKSVNYGK